MSNCCSSKNKSLKKIDKLKEQDEKPKSWIGKYLYLIGKKDAEKQTQKSQSSCH